MRELFKLRNFRIYFFGSTIDTMGDMAFWLASAIWVKELTGSTGMAGLCIMFTNLGSLLSPFTGMLVDRLPRKKTLMVTNALTAVVLLSLVTVHHANQVWLIDLVMFLYGAGSAITNAAFNGLKVQLMPKELFGEASGLSQAAQQGVRLISPGIGLGLLAAYGGPALAVMDAATFVVGLLCWSLVRIEDPRPARAQAQQSWWQESTAGFRYLFGSQVLRQLTIAAAVAVFGMGFFETLGIAVSTVGLHHSPTWVGVLVTVMGVSGLVGGLSSGALLKRIGPGFLLALGLGICAVGAVAMAVPDQYVVLGSAVILGLGLPFAIVGSMTAVQLFTPNELMGRVSGVDDLIVTGLQVLGILIGAALIGVVFYRDLCYFVAVTMGASALYIFTRKAQRKSNLPAPARSVDADAAATVAAAATTVDAAIVQA
ncbi:MAG TPA: MFS transporter [Actinospica sp.]|nr:MFS transporter [Actinospica sp.]